MHEHLDLRAAPARNRANLLERKLAREHDAREAELLQGEDALEVVGHELRGGVEGQGREVRAHEARHAEVLHDEPVGTQLLEQGEALDGGGEVGVVDDRIEGHVDLAVPRARPGEEVAQLCDGEVHGLGTRGEGVEAEVHGVRAGLEGGEGRLE